MRTWAPSRIAILNEKKFGFAVIRKFPLAQQRTLPISMSIRPLYLHLWFLKLARIYFALICLCYISFKVGFPNLNLKFHAKYPLNDSEA